jgi:hypothetical protein
MNEALTIAKARITGAMEVLASMRASDEHAAHEDRSAILSAETLLRGALRDLSDRFGGETLRAPAPRLLMDTLILEGTGSVNSALPFRLSLPGPDDVLDRDSSRMALG